ncbi:vigilin-like [Penaeus vannamei]|uniref:vigilin-like n=1 Tax=Penaeus vannamei TaxID=6689 RepID=UPI00387F535C
MLEKLRDIEEFHYGKVIGRGGARIKYIQDKYKVRVRVPREEGESLITVSGLAADVEKAIKELVQRRHNADWAAEQRRRQEQRGTFPVCVKPRLIGRAVGRGGFRLRHVAQRHTVRIQLPEHKPDGQILVTGLKENALAAVAELELMATNLNLRPEHVLVPLRIKRAEHILVLGPEGSRAAWIQRQFGVRLTRRSVNWPLVLEGDLEAVTYAEAYIEDVLAQRRLAAVRRF